MDGSTLLVVAATLAALIGAPLVQFIKWAVLTLSGKPLEGKAALWVTFVTAAILGLAVVGISGKFSPPYPVDWQGWVSLIGGVISGIFAAATLIYKQLISQAPQG